MIETFSIYITIGTYLCAIYIISILIQELVQSTYKDYTNRYFNFINKMTNYYGGEDSIFKRCYTAIIVLTLYPYLIMHQIILYKSK